MRLASKALGAAFAALLVFGAADVSAQSSFAGTYTLDRQASDNLPAAINRAVAGMNFVTRPVARGRLTKTNAMYQRVVIGETGGNTSVTFDSRPAIVSPANGTAVKWTREDGEAFDLSTATAAGRLTQTFRAEDGQRVNVYSLSPDGRTLTMDVTITSPRLSSPLRYKLVYNRS